MAASRACIEPSGITCMPSRPQPCWRASSRLSQSVSEPPVVTPMRLPLRSATVLTGDFASTTTARFDGAPYIAATPIAGTPLARKPSPGPEPSATSTAPAVRPACICASPLKLEIARSMPSCLKMPACTPTSVAAKAHEFGTDLPMRSLSCASAGPLASTAASNPATTDLRLVTINPSRRCAAFPEFCAIIGTMRSRSNCGNLRRGLQSRHHLVREQRNRPLRFRKRQIAERELSDAVVAAGGGELLAQERRHGRG